MPDWLIGVLSWLSMFLLMFVGLLLMGIILLQRGRGGGLAGAFGGLGGQSAFGTKAGDVFTKITIIMAVIWVLLAGSSKFFLEAAANRQSRQLPTGAEADDAPALRDQPESDDRGADERSPPLRESDDGPAPPKSGIAAPPGDGDARRTDGEDTPPPADGGGTGGEGSSPAGGAAEDEPGGTGTSSQN
ncbi:MAG: preprotein translocase subunit SecG [Planctomycetes bacterium]|nr:preprotein translocase subunit SecG [Planctomycetota bacterium]